jgi:hypothetical protein
MKNHRFKSITKGGRKGRRGQQKKIRVGSRTPGSTGIGSIRHPY